MTKAKNYIINPEAAPKDWSKFKRWHPLACKSDPLSTEERFIKLGGVIPKKKKSGVQTISKKK